MTTSPETCTVTKVSQVQTLDPLPCAPILQHESQPSDASYVGFQGLQPRLAFSCLLEEHHALVSSEAPRMCLVWSGCAC